MTVLSSFEQVSSFHRLSFRRFVVLSFCRFTIETKEPGKFQIFEFETRPPMIATVVMATRMTQPECAIEARHVSQLFGCAIQVRGSRDQVPCSFCAYLF